MKRRTPRHAVPIPDGERRSLLAWVFGWRPEPDEPPRTYAPAPQPAPWLDGGPEVWLPQPETYGTGIGVRPLTNGEWGGLRELDDTQPLEGVVIDDTPQPASAPGLAPVADPATMILPVLNAQQQRGRTRVLRLPFTGPRRRRGQRMFTDFDPEFYTGISRTVHQAATLADRLAAQNDQHDAAIMARLRRLDEAHRARVAAEGGAEYASQLAIVSGPQTAQPTRPVGDVPPLPRRIPGASLPPGQQHRGRRPHGSLGLERRTFAGGAL